MKIHYTTTVWHGGFYKYFGDALKSLGHEVYFFDEAGTSGQKLFGKVITRVPGYAYKGDAMFCAAVSRDWLKSIEKFNPDLVVIQHSPNITADAVRKAKEQGRTIFYWEDAEPADSQAKEALACLGYADKIFSVDRKWMTILYRQSDFVHLPLAGEPSVFRPLSDAEKEYDVVYVGSFPPRTGDGYLRAKIMSDIPGKFKVAAFGTGLGYWFDHLPNLRQRSGGGKILTDTALNEIYNKSKIVLAIHATGHISSISARTYEIGLSGAFQLVDWREDDDILFPKGMLVNFKNTDEINGLIEEWMAKPEERERRAAETRDYILAHHTWKHRAEEMLKYFKK